MRRWPALLVALAVLAAACGGGSSKDTAAKGPTAVVVVDAPFAELPFAARAIERGSRLAVERVNAAGGVPVGTEHVRLVIRRRSSGLSPTRLRASVQRAGEEGAVAMVVEGTGVIVAADAAPGVPIGVAYQGGASILDLKARRNVFRVAPTDRGVSFRLAEYLVPKGLHLGVLTDDSEYGQQGQAALRKALGATPDAVAGWAQVSGDPAPELVALRDAGATALLVWARPATLAAAVRRAREAGWDVPVYASTSASDPLFRQQLADHPEWVDGVTFAFARITSERGPGPFDAFRRDYERRFGPERVGVTWRGHQVVSPPDWASYAYDFVGVVAAAMSHAGVRRPGPRLVRAMEQVEAPGANGDIRGFNELSHEGIVDDDIAFARFEGMVFVPVKDDPLSATLPDIPQLL